MQECLLNDVLSSITEEGYALSPAVVDENQLQWLLTDIEAARESATVRKRGAGVFAMRHLLKEVPQVKELAESQVLCDLVKPVLGRFAFPVRAVLLDKIPDANWYVAWHQDLTIAVKKRIELPGFGPWSVKNGILHVQPPIEYLSRMLAVRLHLDDCPAENGALKVMPKSQNAGFLNAKKIEEWGATTQHVVCPANRGDAILMRPLLLHSSSPSDAPGHRRIIHIEYAAEPLPGGLEWAIA
jgi:ectoine hydroxylase-related dioxygenase (phytanoyl-CoA dioxygenase family)